MKSFSLVSFEFTRKRASVHRGKGFWTRWLLQVGLSSAVLGAFAIYMVFAPVIDIDEIITFIAPSIIVAAAFLVVPFTSKPATYYATQVLLFSCFFLTIVGSSGMPAVQMTMLLAVISHGILVEPFPSNLVISIFVVSLAAIIQRTSAPHTVATLRGLIDYQVAYILPGYVIAVLGSLMTRYREFVVDLTRSEAQLTESVVHLARANSEYQDYAVSARERAAEAERQRITRDIHDIVGYTLTNNMMLMEAAQDLMKENPLSLPGIIETARQNAEEGLEEVRAAMYRLRDQREAYPVGLDAVSRLVRVFEQATTIHIHTDYGNMPRTISDEVDSAVYHLVQEALVNSFRHGNARNVHIQLRYSVGSVHVRVRDDGTGGALVLEGIGLRGMHERIELLGGTMCASAVEDGFLISASVPVRKDET